MEWFVLLAVKSLLVAGAVLLLLKLMRGRSAADRSLVAHLGLGALLLLPVAALALPAFEVAAPDFLARPAQGPVIAQPPVPAPEVAANEATFRDTAASPAAGIVDSVDWGFWAYALPAGLLLLLTLIAIGRLVPLKARAQVLVDQHWLTALARAQHRMGFKNGTALLTSDDIRSPISWGLMRPVILLNSDAAQAKDEAEAIIAHELAHVARFDWAKLLLARVTVAIFWFNPLVWLLAREAHQLREEAADDAVLAANIEDTEYARLLVGIARHECRGLLLGAHGVAPARNSLARRVQRVLDSALSRAPGGWRWSAAAGFFAAGMAVPVAALQFVPVTPAATNAQSVGGKVVAQTEAAAPAQALAQTEVLPPAPATTVAPDNVAASRIASVADSIVRSHPGGTIDVRDGHAILRSPSGGTISVAPPDAQGRRATVLTGPDGSVIAYADARSVPGLTTVIAEAPRPPRPPRPSRHHDDAIDRAVELKAVGASPEYVESLRRAAPHLRLDHDDIMALAALRVSAAYIRELVNAGYGRLSADEIAGARAMGVTGAEVERYRRALGRLPSLDKVIEMKAVGVTPDDVRGSGP